MVLYELIESKTKNTLVIPQTKPLNPYAKALKNKTGSAAGPHTPIKYTRKEKHKNNTPRIPSD